MTKFTLFWLDGHIEIGYGNSIEKVFIKLGYGSGSISALDFFTSDILDDSNSHRDYKWNIQSRKWELISIG